MIIDISKLKDFDTDDLIAAQDLILIAIRNSPKHQDVDLWKEGLVAIVSEIRGI